MVAWDARFRLIVCMITWTWFICCVCIGRIVLAFGLCDYGCFEIR